MKKFTHFTQGKLYQFLWDSERFLPVLYQAGNELKTTLNKPFNNKVIMFVGNEKRKNTDYAKFLCDGELIYIDMVFVKYRVDAEIQIIEIN